MRYISMTITMRDYNFEALHLLWLITSCVAEPVVIQVV